MYLMGSSLAHRYYPANYTCTAIVIHVTGEIFSFFLTFLTFFIEMAQVLRFWRPIKIDNLGYHASYLINGA